MEDVNHSDHASLDSLIDWLRTQRTCSPTASFSSLLAGRDFDPQHLIDLACIDLIERRRLGQPIKVESYTEAFPQLLRNELLLDLIDAEICVASELKQTIDPSQYVRRFPQLATQIEELLGLETASPSDGLLIGSSDGRPPTPTTTHEGESHDPSSSFSVELNVGGDRQAGDALPRVGGNPLHAPEWFTAEECFANGPGRWLIRGRDTQRGLVMAMKVMLLPPELCASRSRQILDACEAASKVRNPMWVAPNVAAIQHRHLGVIRPWVFAVSWLSVAGKRDVAAQLRDLASIAYCLEGAHQVGATHGAIHRENILLDHDGKIRLVDAVANREGMQRWLEAADDALTDESILSLADRKQIDTEDLIRLIASISLAWHQAWSEKLIDDLTTIANHESEGAADAVGARLLQYADSPPKTSSHAAGWRNTWKRWRDEA